jgi:hypothetical protein
MSVQLLLNDEDGALVTFAKTMNLFDKPLSNPHCDLMISYLFSLNGMKKEAQPFINEALKAEKIVEELYIAKMYQPEIYFNLAAAFAFTGQDEKALEMLSRIARHETVPIFVILYANHLPYFKNLKEQPEYKKIIGEMEAKYLEQHEKINKLLISRGMEPE